jgi:hypothetical protein
VVAVSTFAKRVQTATLLAYGLVALVGLIGPVLYLTMAVADKSHGSDDANPPAVLLAINPISFVADATAGETVSGRTNPMDGIRRVLLDAKRDNDGRWLAWFPEVGFAGEFGFLDDDERTGTPAWQPGLIWLTALSGGLFLLAARRLRTPAETER